MIFDTRDNVSWWLRIIAVALSIAIIVTGGLLIGWNAFFSQMSEEQYLASEGVDIDDSSISEDGMLDSSEEEEPTPPADETPDPNADATPIPTIKPSALTNLKSNIKNWINNGSPVRDDNVINILLIGMENNDSKGNPRPLSVNGRADAMMIASVNKTTKTITLASLMRDQYSYIVNNGTGTYEKLHHALSKGGPDKQIEMIERYYKIVIDNYVIVNFDTLPKVIDAVGGVDIELTDNEAEFLKNSCGWDIEPKAQKMHVNGSYALTYMRIRKGNTGGDTARVGRQKKVIIELISQAKDYTPAQMVSVVTTIIPNIRTGLSSNDVLAYATTALSEGWLKYEIKQVTLPDGNSAKGFTNSEDGLWYWKVDYPVAAQQLQLALYNKTNISLDPNRKKWI